MGSTIHGADLKLPLSVCQKPLNTNLLLLLLVFWTLHKMQCSGRWYSQGGNTRLPCIFQDRFFWPVLLCEYCAAPQRDVVLVAKKNNTGGGAAFYYDNFMAKD